MDDISNSREELIQNYFKTKISSLIGLMDSKDFIGYLKSFGYDIVIPTPLPPKRAKAISPLEAANIPEADKQYIRSIFTNAESDGDGYWIDRCIEITDKLIESKKRVRELERQVPPAETHRLENPWRDALESLFNGCGNHACRVKKAQGQGTNGPCSCVYKISEWRELIEQKVASSSYPSEDVIEADPLLSFSSEDDLLGYALRCGLIPGPNEFKLKPRTPKYTIRAIKKPETTKQVEYPDCTCGHERSRHDMGRDGTCLKCSCQSYTKPLMNAKQEIKDILYKVTEGQYEDTQRRLRVAMACLTRIGKDKNIEIDSIRSLASKTANDLDNQKFKGDSPLDGGGKRK